MYIFHGRREPGAGRGETGKGRQEKGEGRLETRDGRQNTWWWGRQGVTTNLVHVGGFGLRVIDTLTRTMPQVPSSGLFPIQNTHLQLRNAQNCELQNSLLSHWEDYTGSGPFHFLIVQLSFAKKKVDFLELNSIEKAPQSWIMTAMDNQSFIMIKIQSVPCFQIMLIFLIRQSIPQYDRSPPTPSAPLPTPDFYIVAVALTQYGH